MMEFFENYFEEKNKKFAILYIVILIILIISFIFILCINRIILKEMIFIIFFDYYIKFIFRYK